MAEPIMNRQPVFGHGSVQNAHEAEISPNSQHVWNGKPEFVNPVLTSQRCANCGQLAVTADLKCFGKMEDKP